MIENILSTIQDLVPESTALVVYDMQVGIVSQTNESVVIAKKVAELLSAARIAHIPVFFTRHISLPRELMGNFQLRQAMAWQKVDKLELVNPWFLRDSPGAQIIPELTPLPSEAVVEKITMSAFEGTFLSFALSDLGIKSFIIAGIALEIGIEPTVRHATDLGLIPILAEDACGFGHQEAANNCIEIIRYSGDVILSDTNALCGRMLAART